MKVILTDFAERHFDKKFGGTKILNMNSTEFLERANFDNAWVFDGYAPFCKIAVIDNFTQARVGAMKITMANYQYLRSGYSSRNDKELPVLSRWFEMPLPAPRARYLAVVLYDKAQLEIEEAVSATKEARKHKSFNCDYGIVAILGQDSKYEEPMKPATMLRNALGVKEGGSGVKINREAYERSVNFWNTRATLK